MVLALRYFHKQTKHVILSQPIDPITQMVVSYSLHLFLTSHSSWSGYHITLNLFDPQYQL
jgi:hypothetical protein